MTIKRRKRQRSTLEEARKLVQAYKDELEDIAQHEAEARQIGDAQWLQSLQKGREHTAKMLQYAQELVKEEEEVARENLVN